MSRLFALTLFSSSALLFWVELLIARMILPILGGSPAVWTTCLLFFQAALLAGYALAHASANRLDVARHGIVQVGLLGAALVFLPPAVSAGWTSALGNQPTVWTVLAALAWTIGLPFLGLAATAPALQSWYARARLRGSGDPYFLYAASNGGSLFALATYPAFVEPSLALTTQARFWSIAFAAATVLVGASAAIAWRQRRSADSRAPSDATSVSSTAPGDSNSARSWPRWVMLSFVPSSLLLGVTSFLTTDIAAVPLLWVIPLALYLLSFVEVFSRTRRIPQVWIDRAFPISVMVLTPALAAKLVWAVWLPIHLLVFLLASLACHGKLARLRPPGQSATSFYLALSFGGLLGGIFNALIAPAVFTDVWEYPLAIVLALLTLVAVDGQGESLVASKRAVRAAIWLPLGVFILIAIVARDPRGVGAVAWHGVPIAMACGLLALACWRHRSRSLQFALTVAAALGAAALAPGPSGHVLHRERSFFGVLRVTQDEQKQQRRLIHGSTLHGLQSLEPEFEREPLSYYTRLGPIGQVFDAFERSPSRSRAVAVVGLGVGTLAAYAKPGQVWTFVEIDPAVARIARDPRYFTYLRDSAASAIRIDLGDARLRLRNVADGSLGLILLDAFGSDSPPVHLLTREAFRLYRSKLAPGGLIAVNLSTRYLDLDPVMGTLARDQDLACRIRRDFEVGAGDRRVGKTASIWAILAANEAGLGPIARDSRWRPAPIQRGERPWTDDFTNVARHLLLWSR